MTPAILVPRRARGFTLIELLTVIAIIGILAAITIPVVGSVRDTAKKTKTRIQFTQWAAGIRNFKNTYGYFPQFNKSITAAANRVNGGLKYNDTAIGDNDYLFRELLSGQPAKPNSPGFIFASSEKPTGNSIQNKKRTKFVQFDISEITSTTGADAGDPEILVDGAIKDAFGNVEIVVLTDTNGDGFVNLIDSGLTAYPAVTAKGNTATLASATIKSYIDKADPNQNGVRADVIIYSPGKGRSSAVSETDAVWSW